jgi:hypothetical protein
MLRIGTSEYFESLEGFRRHLPPTKDEEILILKGHLLVEILLEKYLHQNLAFVESLHSRPPDARWLWKCIRFLNALRNDLAHKIDSQSYASLLNKFIDAVEASPELPELEPPPEIHERLHRALFGVHEGMSYRVDL